MSDITDPAPAPWMPSAVDTAAEAMIKEIEGEAKTSALDSAILSAEPTAESVSAPADGAAPVAEAPAAEVKPDDTERGLERLVAREVELRAEKARVSADLAQIDGFKARIKELEARQAPEDLTFALRTNPHDTLESMGISPDDLVRRVIAARLGDQVPDKLKEQLRNDDTQRQIQELRQSLAQRDHAAAAQAYVTKVNNGAREYVTKGVGEYAPTVARVAKANPERVYREILEEISQDARARSAREPNGEVLSYEEAAKRVETRWVELSGVFSPGTAPIPASTTAPTTPAPGAKNGNPPPVSSTVKPPDRPLAPWLQNHSLEDDGLKAALMEYRRLEGTKS